MMRQDKINIIEKWRGGKVFYSTQCKMQSYANLAFYLTYANDVQGAHQDLGCIPVLFIILL